MRRRTVSPRASAWAVAAVAAGVLALGGCKNAGKMKPVSGEAPLRTLEATTFPHSAHGDVACTDCHEGAAKWAKLGDYQVPSAAKCAECHDKDAMHTPQPSPRPAEYHIRFSHADHMPKMKDANACATCHKVLPEPGVKASTTPPMTACTSCHHHEVEVHEARCTPCHVSLKRFALKPLEQFTEFSHAGNFIREHGILSRNSAETCAQCHDQTYCAQCHATATLPLRPEIRFPENVTSDFIHRGNYVSRHQMDVERDPASCKKCHGSYFCESCHEQNSLTTRSLNPRNPHPRGWVQRGSGAFHGEAARENIVSCAGCHDQGAASNCVACHQVGGSGGNPHPRGFMSRHSGEDKRKNVACRACHTRG